MIQQNPPYDAESVEIERNRIRTLMPENMLGFEQEMREMPAPPAQLPKRNLVTAWFNFFGAPVPLADHDIDRLCRSSRHNIHAAFLWVKENFAELDLGGNYKWKGAAEKVLGYMNRNKWNKVNEVYLFLSLMTDTNWYE